ncbi:hypothetical protein Tco_1371400 [Tanacetum coccineum]
MERASDKVESLVTHNLCFSKPLTMYRTHAATILSVTTSIILTIQTLIHLLPPSHFTQADNPRNLSYLKPTTTNATFTQTAFSNRFLTTKSIVFSQPAAHFYRLNYSVQQTSQTSNLNIVIHNSSKTATISANNASFLPYREKKNYEIWAMEDGVWIRECDHNFGGIVQKGNSPKRLERCKRITIVHPPVLLMSLCCVQGRIGWFWGNEEARSEADHAQAAVYRILVTEEKATQGVYDRYGVKASAAPTHSAFIRDALLCSTLTYSDQQYQEMIFEDLDQVDQLEMGRIGLNVANGYGYSLRITDLRRRQDEE